jgi:hypothetical protein
MSDIDTKANVLLRGTAARQAVVDRLLGRSIWNGFVTAMLVPVIASLVFLIAWSGWYRDRPEHSAVLLGGALSSLVWVSLAVMQVAGRLRALSVILERSGVLARFVGADDRSCGTQSDGGDHAV